LQKRFEGSKVNVGQTEPAMASSMSKPWIKDMVKDLLRSDDKSSTERRYMHRSHIVQVVAVNEGLRSFIVSDTEVVIGVLPTTDCFNNLRRVFRGPIASLKSALLRLDKGGYHLTGIISGSGDRDISKLKDFVSLPMAIHLQGCGLFGE
jgi:hypothetical protein